MPKIEKFKVTREGKEQTGSFGGDKRRIKPDASRGEWENIQRRGPAKGFDEVKKEERMGGEINFCGFEIKKGTVNSPGAQNLQRILPP